MSTDPLIEQLVAKLTPVQSRDVRRDWLLLALLALAELALLLLVGEGRPDLRSASMLPSFWWKIVSLGALALVGVITAVRSFDPTRSPRLGLRWMGAILVVSLVAGLLVGSSLAIPELFPRLMWRDGLACVLTMGILSVPPLIALSLMMRRNAASDLGGSALTVGFASAAWGGLIFAFNCPHDDPLYVALWYVVGSLIVAALARMILPTFARW